MAGRLLPHIKYRRPPCTGMSMNKIIQLILNSGAVESLRTSARHISALTASPTREMRGE